MPAKPAPEPPTMRERYRAQVRQEVKQAALNQLAQSGPAGVSVSAIGKELGVSGPALYRYFASRDELLTELVIDAYHDLADALSAATSREPGQEPRGRFEALVRAYRSWALAQPHRYRLLFGPPLPGYDAHAQRLVEASQAAMKLLLEILRDLGDPTVTTPGPPLASQLWPGPDRSAPASTRRPPCAPFLSGAACTIAAAEVAVPQVLPWLGERDVGCIGHECSLPRSTCSGFRPARRVTITT